MRRGLWEAEHPANNPAAVQAPAQVAHLSPSPSMLHFHHPLCEQGFPLGGHEDGPEADLFDPYFAVTLEEEAKVERHKLGFQQTCEGASLGYLLVVGTLEPGDLLWVSVSVVAISGVPMGGHVAPPLRRGAELRPGGCGVAPAGCVIQPALSRAHHTQVLRMLAVIHPPAVVFAFLQGLFRSVAAYVVHPYGT